VADDDVGPLLSRLRDVRARRVLVVARRDCSSAWSRRSMVGYGFTPFGTAEADGAPAKLYQFDIATYKTTPDWLNARNWANPELWDKYRW
ncbi:MAG: DUF6231 family protein, partial [Ectothiorhodospiraceae bacterium]